MKVLLDSEKPLKPNQKFTVNLLIRIHLAIHLSDTDDVRPTLQHYSQFGNPMVEFRRRAHELASADVTIIRSFFRYSFFCA